MDDPHLLIGQRVRVHFNLHNKLWSIIPLAGPGKGRVAANLTDITLAGGVEFRVSRAGWERCRRQGRRSVHAYCVGLAEAINSSPDLEPLVRVTYNPARGPDFQRTDTSAAITLAERVVFAKRSSEDLHGYAWIAAQTVPADTTMPAPSYRRKGLR
ncbi:hypothetical protein [Actinomadura kijaniata]|uniref:hypothetical protein n=1 Tax=Actinomadura kijaniata TaxID=46161 RepID=UPI000834DC39|nr:hypothetical protein [Actinomadura kijaniata]